jgi:hypothetical protein
MYVNEGTMSTIRKENTAVPARKNASVKRVDGIIRLQQNSLKGLCLQITACIIFKEKEL